jgi:hypothetical protein
MTDRKLYADVPADQIDELCKLLNLQSLDQYSFDDRWLWQSCSHETHKAYADHVMKEVKRIIDPTFRIRLSGTEETKFDGVNKGIMATRVFKAFHLTLEERKLVCQGMDLHFGEVCDAWDDVHIRFHFGLKKRKVKQ